jgi:hypothetical protein
MHGGLPCLAWRDAEFKSSTEVEPAYWGQVKFSVELKDELGPHCRDSRPASKLKPLKPWPSNPKPGPSKPKAGTPKPPKPEPSKAKPRKPKPPRFNARPNKSGIIEKSPPPNELSPREEVALDSNGRAPPKRELPNRGTLDSFRDLENEECLNAELPKREFPKFDTPRFGLKESVDLDKLAHED